MRSWCNPRCRIPLSRGFSAPDYKRAGGKLQVLLDVAATYLTILSQSRKRHLADEPLYVPFAVVVLGGTTIFWSFREGEAGNLMFDGGILYGTTVLMYLYSVIPNVMAKFSSLPHYQINEPFPRVLPSPTLDLASNHLICSVALTGILILQAGRWWAELSDRDDDPTFLQEKSEGPSTPAEEPISQPPLHAPIPTL
ncbi:hypothetical protein EDD15DRAFT_366454 [Pisolithus albus]|nr:hypothetical protein EDD15DRAFT_366454 [Pisolithus albus]